MQFIKGHQEAVSLKENENQVSGLRGQKQHLKSHAKMLPGRNTGLGTDYLLPWESGCKLPSPIPAQILPPLCQQLKTQNPLQMGLSDWDQVTCLSPSCKGGWKEYQGIWVQSWPVVSASLQDTYGIESGVQRYWQVKKDKCLLQVSCSVFSK